MRLLLVRRLLRGTFRVCDVPWVQGTFRGGSWVEGRFVGECILTVVGLRILYVFTADIAFCICNEQAI
jgi:hypothetical protein